MLSSNPRSQPSTPFPYTTLFRSEQDLERALQHQVRLVLAADAERHVDVVADVVEVVARELVRDRKSTRLNSSHLVISYAVFCLKKKKKGIIKDITQRTAAISNKS